MNKILAAFAGYCLVAMITFGYAYNTRPDTYQWGNYTLTNSTGQKVFDAMFMSAFWPLYVSTIAWEGAKK